MGGHLSEAAVWRGGLSCLSSDKWTWSAAARLPIESSRARTSSASWCVLQARSQSPLVDGQPLISEVTRMQGGTCSSRRWRSITSGNDSSSSSAPSAMQSASAPSRDICMVIVVIFGHYMQLTAASLPVRPMDIVTAGGRNSVEPAGFLRYWTP